jgi:putative peptidoglycan lipid II flippase
MNLAFIVPLKHAGLALAISLGACLNATLLYRRLRRDGIFQPQPGWKAFLGKVALAVAAMGGLLVWLAGPDAAWLEAGTLTRAGRLAVLVAAGGATYFATLWLLGVRLAQFYRRAAD